MIFAGVGCPDEGGWVTAGVGLGVVVLVVLLVAFRTLTMTTLAAAVFSPSLSVSFITWPVDSWLTKAAVFSSLLS